MPSAPNRRTSADAPRSEVRVCHLSSVHRPDDPRILDKECATLRSAGYDVSLVAPAPPLPSSAGVPHVVVRRRAGRMARMLRTVAEVARAAKDQAADVYHIHDPELLPLGLVLRTRGRTVIYDAHEDLGSQVRHKAWIPAPLRPLIGRVAAMVERRLARRLSAVVAATPGIAAHFPMERTIVVRNLARREEFADAPSTTPYARRDPIVAYVGNVTVPRGAREMVRAMAGVKTPAAGLRVAGEFSPPTLGHELTALPGWDRIEVLGWQDRRGVAALLARSRIGLVVLHPTPSYLESYPVKLFEYMAAGLPVVASDFPLWRSIIEDAGCGVLVDPLDPSAIASAIDTLLADAPAAETMGERGRRAVEERWSWEPEGERLVALYDRLAGISGSVGP